MTQPQSYCYCYIVIVFEVLLLFPGYCYIGVVFRYIYDIFIVQTSRFLFRGLKTSQASRQDFEKMRVGLY